MARILIVGGGRRGRELAARLVEEGGHAVRITTRTEAGRTAIEASGAECLIGTPDRLASLRGALDGVTIACWMLATAQGDPGQTRELHGSRLESFLSGAVDTTMRGFVYEASSGGAGAEAEAGAEAALTGERIACAVAERNAIPLALLRADAADAAAWQAEAWEAIDGLLAGRVASMDTLS